MIPSYCQISSHHYFDINSKILKMGGLAQIPGVHDHVEVKTDFQQPGAPQ